MPQLGPMSNTIIHQRSPSSLPPPLENFLIHAWFCNIFGYYVRLGLFSNKAKALLHVIGFHTSILTSHIIILQYNKTCSLQYQRNETRGLWSLRRNLKSAQVLVYMTVHYPSFSNFFFNFFNYFFISSPLTILRWNECEYKMQQSRAISVIFQRETYIRGC